MNTPSNTKKIKNCKLLKCRYEETHPNKIEDLQELEAYEMRDAVLVYDSSNSCSLEDMSMGSIFLDLPVHNASHNFSQHVQASGPGELVPLPRANPDEYGEHESVDSHGEKGSVDSHREHDSVNSPAGGHDSIYSPRGHDSVFRPEGHDWVAGCGECDSMFSPRPSELLPLTSSSQQKAMTSNGKDSPCPALTNMIPLSP